MSSLLELDSSFAPLTLEQSITTVQSHDKKWRSPVWAHCCCPTKDENQAFLYCSHCLPDSEDPLYREDVALNIKKHLKRWHNIIVLKALSKNQEAVNKQLKQLHSQARANGETEEFDTKVLDSCLDTGVLTKALITLIIVQNLSFALVEWPEFHTLCQVLN